MSMPFKLIDWLLVAVIVGVLLSVFEYGKHVEGFERDKAASKAAIENAATTAKLQGEKHEAQKRIDDLAADNKRLRVLLPKCGLRKADATHPASGSVQTAASGKSLPERPEDPQAALDEFMAGTDTAIHEADTAINECRVVTEWAKSLCKLYSCAGPK